ncbi:phosphotransferase [Microlunatus elymi]|uniref:Phosphotransferase n=1 Tax=Microlunatus elymi TaxID=2596828 RepID=A0A516PVU2_9ACTN|nr:aminoglycoside phosphotransferase family protein [Microlunatus elymi]QDP95308.1 phosphotransferase [Microlunatus elymi]
MPAEIELGTLAATARAGEAEALRLWAGHGAVRLLEHDAATGAMLTERCVPGSSLEDILDGAETDRVAIALLTQLHDPQGAEGFVRLADRATALAKDIVVRHERCGAPFDQWLVDLSVDLLTDLASSESAPVILHGDFHHHNILAAQRAPWLAIDPLPMVGDPAYDAVQYLLFRKGDLADPEKEWGPVIHQFCSGLGVDPERVMAWLFVRLVSDAVAAHVEEGEPVALLEHDQADLWSARLIHRLRA